MDTERLGLLRWSDQGGHYVAVPLLADAVAAGPPAAVREDHIQNWAIIYKDRSWMPGRPYDYTCVRVRGDSMWPVLADGDIAAIDHSESLRSDLAAIKQLNKRIVAFRVDGGITLKWLIYKEEESLVLGLPENKAEIDTTIILRGDQINQGIVGLVRWWWSRR
ncbi:MAG: S24 family peptidase [Thermodesulfobacteriota bacterium]